MRLDAHNEIGLDDIVKKVQNKEIKWNAIITETFFEAFSDGCSDKYAYEQSANDLILKAKGDVNVSDWSWYMNPKEGRLKKIGKRLFPKSIADSVDIQTINTPDAGIIKMTKGERVAALLNDMAEVNKTNILAKGFSFEQSPTQIHKITEADWNAIIDSATPEERVMAVDGFFRYFNEYAPPKINKTSVELNGFEVATEYPYYPKVTSEYDRKRNFLKRPSSLTPETLFNFSNSTLEGMGPLKERTGALNAIVLQDVFKTYTEHTKLMGAYLGYANALRNAKALLYDSTFKKELINRWGKQNWGYLNEYIQSLEKQSVSTESLDKLTGELINKLDPALLGLNPWVIGKQPVSVLLARLEFSHKHFTQGIKNISKETEIEMNEHSPFFRNRLESGAVSIELGENAEVGEIRRIFTGKQLLSQQTMKGVKWGDYQAIGRIWEMAKAEVNDKYPNLIDKDFWMVVEKRTRQVVERTQPTFEWYSRSALGRSRSWHVRLATKYSTQRNKTFNIKVRAINRYNASQKTREDKGKLFFTIFIAGFLVNLSIGGINVIRRKVFSLGKDKKDEPHWAVQWMTETFATALGTVYFAGDLFSSAASKLRYGTFSGWGYNNPTTSFLDVLTDATGELGRTISQVITKEKYERGDKEGEKKWVMSANRLIRHIIQLTGTLKGLNTTEVMRWIDLGWRLHEGDVGEKGLSAEEIRKKYGIGGATPSSSKETTTGLSAQEIREKYNIK
jgi:hypothetical protein